MFGYIVFSDRWRWCCKERKVEVSFSRVIKRAPTEIDKDLQAMHRLIKKTNIIFNIIKKKERNYDSFIDSPTKHMASNMVLLFLLFFSNLDCCYGFNLLNELNYWIKFLKDVMQFFNLLFLYIFFFLTVNLFRMKSFFTNFNLVFDL